MGNSAKIQAVSMEEGDGAEVKRLFPIAGLRNYDPFVLFDHFAVSPPAGFPTHPHRGFEAITYMFQGRFRHEDSLGNKSEIGPGGAQRFTAGKGLMHSEMPAGDEVGLGIQLWINLAKKDKGIDPDYQEVKAEDIPEKEIGGCRIRYIVGEEAPVKLITPVVYQDIVFSPGGKYETEVPKEFLGLIYVVNGEISRDDEVVSEGEALILEEGGFCLQSQGDSRVMFVAGKPHGEPIYQHGPFVD